jgi:hypothetical protein
MKTCSAVFAGDASEELGEGDGVLGFSETEGSAEEVEEDARFGKR